MQLLEPLLPDQSAFLPRANPLAKLGAASFVMVAAFVAVDLFTPTLLVAAELALLPAAGIRLPALGRRLWPLLLAAAVVGLLNAVLAADPVGEPIFKLGPLLATDASVLAGVALAVRLVAIALAGVLALATTDPTHLADSLLQQLRVSPRVAVGSLAGLRALPVLAEEWQTIGLARRARGVDAGYSPVAAVRLFGGRLLALLIRAVRRGTRMAAAMEARGLGARDCRSVARPVRMTRADWLLLAGGAATAAGATLVSVVTGNWRFLLS
jgi:energy-coupling factor transport system permease protein